METKVIGLVNQKGGVGKSNVTLNLAAGLARQGKKVMALDLDPQGSLMESMGYKNPDHLDKTIADIMRMTYEGTEIPPDFGILHHEEGIDLVPANIELAGMEVSLVNAMSRELVLRDYISTQKGKYDYIITDNMPSLGMLTINTLAAANSIIIPSQPSYLSIKGMEQLLKTIARVRRQINPPLKIDGILMTMVDSRTNMAKDILSLVRSTYGGQLNVFKNDIPYSVRAAEASAYGKSIFTYDKNGKVAQAYEGFVREVLNDYEKYRRKHKDDIVR